MDYSKKMKKAQLIEEIEALQERIAELEHAEAERKRAEEALRESEEELRMIFGGVRDGIALIDMTGEVIRVNERIMEIGGYTEEEIVGKRLKLLKMFPPQSLAKMLPNFSKLMLGQEVPPFDVEVYTKAGEKLDVELQGSLLRRRGRIVGMIGVMRDITERKRAEEALRGSEARYRDLVEHSFDLICTHDLQGQLLLVNPAAGNISGYTAEQLVGTNLRDYVAPDVREQFDDYLAEVEREGEASGLMRVVTHSGEQRIWEYHNSLRVEGVGAPIVRGTARDITERKQAEGALRESEERYRLLVENATVIIVVAQGEMLKFFNPKAMEITGYSQEELVSKSFLELIHPDDQEVTVGYYLKFLQGEETPPIHVFRVIDKGGNIKWLESNAVLITWEDSPATLNFLSDITERKRAEEARVRSQRTLLALSQAAQAVQRARTPQEVYQTVGDEVAGLGYHAVILTLTDDRAHLAISHVTFELALVRAAEKLAGALAKDYCVPIEPGGFYDQVVNEGRTIFLPQILEPFRKALPRAARPLAGQILGLVGVEQAIYTPLKVGGELYGLLFVTGVGLTENDVPAVSTFANQAAIALENARLFEQVQASRERLRDLTDYLQTAREEERTYIAQEIHDEFGQALTALRMDLSWLTKRLPADKPGLAEKASTMSGLVDDTIQTVRRVAARLRPGLLDDLGLAAAIEWQVGEFAERTGIDCQLYMSDEEIALDHDLATAVFRILQETLTNVARHAQATEVHVELKVRPDELVLVMRDNGKGITERQASDPRSLGLMGMRERAHSWDGEVTFEGIPGQRTTVTVRMPRL